MSMKHKQLTVFTASWCNPCKSLKQLIAENNLPVDKITIIDIDEAPLLASEFGVRSVPTLILFEDDSQVAVKSGGMNKTQLLSFCENN